MNSLTHQIDLTALQSLEQDQVADFLPSIIRERVNAIPSEIYDMPFEALERKLSVDGHVPIELSRVRIAFWLEFERASRTGIPFSLAAVCGGVMGLSKLQKEVLANSYRLAYIITPPPSYALVMDEFLHYGLQLQREILNMPHVNPKNGRTDTAMLSLKNKIIEGIHNRVKGMPTSKSVHIQKQLGEGELINPAGDIKEIDAKIAELESSEKEVKSLRRGES